MAYKLEQIIKAYKIWYMPRFWEQQHNKGLIIT